MAISTIPVFTGTSPDRNTQSAAAFTINSIGWLDYQLVQIDATNVSIEGINLAVIDINADVIAAASSAADSASSASDSAASAVTSQSNANFKGRWSDATGAATVPASYSNNGQTWQLLQDIPDITVDEPLPLAANWQVVNEINMANVNVSELENPLFHGFAKNDLVRVMNGATDLSSERNTIAKFVGINGTVRTVAIDDPREEETGWLLEGAGENLALQSEAFDNVLWAKTGTTVNANSGTAPDGAITADTLDIDASSASGVSQDATVPGGTASKTFTVSGFVRSTGSAERFRLKNTHGGVVDSFSSDLVADSNFKKFSFTITNSSAVGTGIQKVGLVNEVVGGVKSLEVWGFQVEEKPFATSGISTAATTETRSADNISFPVEGNFRESQGCIFLKADVIGDIGADQYIFEASDGTNNNRQALIRSSDKIRLLIVDGGVTQVDISTTFDMDPFTQYEIAVNYADNNVELFVDSVSIGVDTSCTMPTGLTIVNAGKTNSPGNELFGHIQDKRFYQEPRNIDEIKYLGGQ